MELFLGGVAIGFVLAIALFWNRTTNLEDELFEKTKLLNTAVRMLREERGNRCGSSNSSIKS